VVVLGRIAFDTYLRIRRQQGWGWPAEPGRAAEAAPGGRPAGRERRKPAFGHGRVYTWGAGRPALIASYHPSRQNTNTGVLTESMFDEVFAAARLLLARGR